jgi:hypothetical protein
MAEIVAEYAGGSYERFCVEDLCRLADKIATAKDDLLRKGDAEIAIVFVAHSRDRAAALSRAMFRHGMLSGTSVWAADDSAEWGDLDVRVCVSLAVDKVA